MIQDIKAPVTTYLYYDHKRNKVYPVLIRWDGVDYKIQNVGMHYTYRNGKTLFHVYTASSSELSFKLVLNTDTLFWNVEQISDGLPD
jgi:hypothetical protein